MRNIRRFVCSAVAMVAFGTSVHANESQVAIETEIVKNDKVNGNKNGSQEAYFEQGNALPDCKLEKSYKCRETKNKCCDLNEKYPQGYNKSANINMGSWAIDVNASFIYWYTQEDELDVAFVEGTQGDLETPVANGTVAYQNFNYEPGFKVGLGLNSNYDGWNAGAEYTWLHQNKTLNQSNDDGWSATSWFTQADVVNAPDSEAVFDSVSSYWKMNLDMVDVFLSRPYYQGTHLTITPNGGLRGLWIRQNLNIGLLDSTDDTLNAYSNNKSQSWAVGPKVGVTAHWLLGKALRIEGVANTSLLYTRYTTISHKEQDDSGADTVPFVTNIKNYGTLRPTLDLGAGFGFGSYMFKNKFYADLAVRYDFNMFWEQNVMQMLAGNAAGTFAPIGDLFMHGLTITAQFDF